MRNSKSINRFKIHKSIVSRSRLIRKVTQASREAFFKKGELFKSWEGLVDAASTPSPAPSSIFLPRFVTFISFPCSSIANASVFGFDKSRAAKTILPRPFPHPRNPPLFVFRHSCSFRITFHDEIMTWRRGEKVTVEDSVSSRSSPELESIWLFEGDGENTFFVLVGYFFHFFFSFSPFSLRKGNERWNYSLECRAIVKWNYCCRFNKKKKKDTTEIVCFVVYFAISLKACLITARSRWGHGLIYI